jgi:teichuronic acid biosynthesis glycosyltransferase TuaC
VWSTGYFMHSDASPRLIVFSSLFPHTGQPGAGLFVRERLFRVGRVLPITVVSPRPWFPGQGLIRRFRPGYRPPAPLLETQDGVTVRFPRFFAFPGIGRRFDGLFMAVSCLPLLWRLQREGYNLIDAHFAYPDGYAASLLGRWLRLPACITLRGSETPQSRNPVLRARIAAALGRAAWVFAVADALRRLGLSLGLAEAKAQVVGNGVDVERFAPMDRLAARTRFGLPGDAQVLISVGGLVERKGFHRVIACLPDLLARHPDLYYLIVGGSSPEGDMSAALKQQVADLGLGERVRFLGALPPDELKWPLSAADVFVLATSNEGWANVFLEAMACGLPVVTTDVGGNREVVCREDLGEVVSFGDQAALAAALERALGRTWDRRSIRAWAEENSWDSRVKELVATFRRLLESRS